MFYVKLAQYERGLRPDSSIVSHHKTWKRAREVAKNVAAQHACDLEAMYLRIAPHIPVKGRVIADRLGLLLVVLEPVDKAKNFVSYTIYNYVAYGRI